MRKKLSLDAKIKKDYFPECETTLEENKDKDNKKNKEFNENNEKKENKENTIIQKKLDPNEIIEEKSKKFSQLGEDIPPKEKFKFIFHNSYHRIIISFFTINQQVKPR